MILDHLSVLFPANNFVDKDEIKVSTSSETDPAVKQTYLKANITNKYDNKIWSELDKADAALEKGSVAEAIRLYDGMILRYPESPRAFYGRARALVRKAELQQSNTILEEAIEEFQKLFSLPDVPKSLMILTGQTCAEKQSFRGWGGKAAKTLRQLVTMFPDELPLWNDLGVKYMLIGRTEDARQAFNQVLTMDPQNGFAKVHVGFILKTADKKYEESIPYLTEGIATDEPGVIDGRFFFHLGDALFRTNQTDEAYKVYQIGSEKGIFMSMWQRSLYNVEPLAARPWWKKTETKNAKFFNKLEENWRTIRDEGLENLDQEKGVFKLEEEDLREKGDWRQFTLYQQGQKNDENCKRAPTTCALLEEFKEAVTCKRGQIKFSVMHPGVHVWPHCGPTNCRVRSHLGLVVPDGARIRVANETRAWKLGKFIHFDDSYEHEVWHDGTSLRMVLIIDIWHPELTAQQKSTLTPI